MGRSVVLNVPSDATVTAGNLVFVASGFVRVRWRTVPATGAPSLIVNVPDRSTVCPGNALDGSTFSDTAVSASPGSSRMLKTKLLLPPTRVTMNSLVAAGLKASAHTWGQPDQAITVVGVSPWPARKTCTILPDVFPVVATSPPCWAVTASREDPPPV